MTSTWKINGTSTADLNVSSLKIVLRNHAEDEATWTCEGDGIATAARWAYGDTVDIKMGSTRVFQGVVTSIPREGTGEAERVKYEARGGWYFLSKCFYMQKWSVGESGAQQSKTRVVLGGESPNTQIRDILTCAINAGAPIDIGTISVATVKPPADEQVDLTCANAVDRLLAWFPDTAVWFDYSGGGNPRINLKRRASLASVTLPVAQAAESVTATPRHDLVVPGVQIIYEITSTKTTKRSATSVSTLLATPPPSGPPASPSRSMGPTKTTSGSASRLIESGNTTLKIQTGGSNVSRSSRDGPAQTAPAGL